jgi:molybdopterin-guanine dinucleotide biosynthesis protein A
MTYDAVVIAGGTIEDPRFRRAVGVERKAEIPLLGRPLVEWAIEGLCSAPSVRRIVVVGAPEIATPSLWDAVDAVVPEGAGAVENLMRGLDALPGAESVLMVSGDLPLIYRESLEDLLATAPAADVVFPIVERAVVRSAFPARRWVCAHAAGSGDFTGAAVLLFRPEALRQRRRWAERLFAARRSLFDLVRMWGAGLALKYLLRMLTLAEAEERVSEVLELHARAYSSRYPELAMDVDQASDLPLCEAWLREHGRAPRTLWTRSPGPRIDKMLGAETNDLADDWLPPTLI